MRSAPLDETFGSYLRMSISVSAALWRRDGVLRPGAVSHHRGSATMGEWNKDTVRLIARNQVLLAAKHFPRPAASADRGRQLLVGTACAATCSRVAYLLGKISG